MFEANEKAELAAILAEQLLAELRRLNPGVRYARTRDRTAVGEWIESKGRFAALYTRIIGDGWCRMFTPGGSITEILANGEPPYRPGDWVE